MNLVVKDLFDTLLQFVSDGHKKRRASSLSAIFAISGAMKAQPPMGPPSAADVDKKLDDMAKKDASTAVNFFRQGVVNLKQAFGAMLSSAEGQLDDREASGSYSTVLEAKLVAELLKNKDHATVKKFLFGAGEKFRLSRAKATEAFSNEVLPTNDRVTSAKIQIAATILEHVDSLGDAVQECVHYLENVHALTAVKRDMKSYLEGGKYRNMQSTFKPEKRNIFVNVCALNKIVHWLHHVSNLGKEDQIITLPGLEIEPGRVLDLLYDEKAIAELKILNRCDLCRGFWSFEVGEKNAGLLIINAIAVSREDHVIVVCKTAKSGDWLLNIYDASSGKRFTECPLPFDSSWVVKCRIAVDWNGCILLLTSCETKKTTVFKKGVDYKCLDEEPAWHVLASIDDLMGHEMTVSRSGRVYVGGTILPSRSRSEVRAFDVNGNLACSFGEKQNMCLVGLTTGSNEHVFVLDSMPAEGRSSQVHEFNPKGELVRSFDMGAVSTDSCIAFDYSHDLIVAVCRTRSDKRPFSARVCTTEGKPVNFLSLQLGSSEIAVTWDGRLVSKHESGIVSIQSFF